MGVTQPAELQERGPSSPLPPLTKARGKTLYLPLTATSTDSSIQQLNWISSLDRGDSGRRRDCGKKRRQMRRSISSRPPFHSVLKRTSRRSEEPRPARLAVLMLKMAPVTNYGGPGSFPRSFGSRVLPCFGASVCHGRTKGPSSSGLKSKHLQSSRSFSINVPLLSG